MPSVPSKKLSQLTTVAPLPAGTTVPVLLTPQAQPDVALRNRRATAQQLAAFVAPYISPATNIQPGGPFRVTNRADTDPNYVAGNTTLAGINNAYLCINAPATVEFDPAGNDQEYLVKYDGDPTRTPGAGVQAFKDGTCTGPTLPAKWVRPTEVLAFIPYASVTAGYLFLTTQLVSAVVTDAATPQFFYPRTNGPHPAPASKDGDPTHWAPVNRADIPVISQTPFYRAITVAVAQQMAADGDAIQPIFYRILRGSNGSPAARRGDVVVQGIVSSPATVSGEGDIPAQFATVGLWLNPASGEWVQVLYDVATDTVVPLDFNRLAPVVLTAQNGKTYGFQTLADASASGLLLDSSIILNSDQDAAGLDLGDVAQLYSTGKILYSSAGTPAPPQRCVSTLLQGVPVGGRLALCDLNDVTILGPTRTDVCQFTGTTTVAATLTLGPGTLVPAGFFSAFTLNPDGTYTTPDGGTVVDERGATATYTTATDIEITDPTKGLIMTVGSTRVRAQISGTAGARTWTFTDL